MTQNQGGMTKGETDTPFFVVVVVKQEWQLNTSLNCEKLFFFIKTKPSPTHFDRFFPTAMTIFIAD